MPIAIYDLDKCPTSYDFLTFCVVAKSYDVDHIVFAPKNKFTGPNKKQYSIEEKQFRLTHILYPICSLMELEYSTFPEYGILPGEAKEWSDKPHFLCEILKRYREQPNLFWPQPSERAKEIIQDNYPEKPVVITLRECYTQGRNSNIEEWIKLAEHIWETNDVVFVRDTAKFTEDLIDWAGLDYPCFPVASIDVDLRLALYQHAKLNMSVGGGPTILFHYSTDIPYLSFKIAYDGFKSSSIDFLTQMGFPPGSQFPWAAKNQRIVWEDDTFENMKEAYDRWLDE